MNSTNVAQTPAQECELIFLRNLARRAGDKAPMTGEEAAMALEVGREFAGRRPVVLASPSWRSASVAREIAVGAGDAGGSYEETSEVGDPSLFVLPGAEEEARSSLEAVGGKEALLEAMALGREVKGWQSDVRTTARLLVRNCLVKSNRSTGRLVVCVTYDLVPKLVIVGLTGRWPYSQMSRNADVFASSAEQVAGGALRLSWSHGEWPYLGRLVVRLERDGARP